MALLPPRPLAARIDALRTALGDPRLGDLPAHLTLVPPIDLAAERSAALPALLRSVAAAERGFTIGVGPATTFAPRTMTLHLGVDGDVAALATLRDSLRRAPLDRPDEHEFVPHVTLLQRASAEAVRAGVELLHEPLGEWTVTSVHLLERLRLDTGPIWHPVAEEPLGGPDVVGRGGVELHLRPIRVVEPAVAELVGAGSAGEAGDRPWAPPLPSGEPVLVVVAELPGTPGVPVGAAVGRAGVQGAVLDRVVVDAGHRRAGIARQVVQWWCAAAVGRGAGVVVAHRDPDDGSAAVSLAEALGFTPIRDDLWVRRVGPLAGPSAPPGVGSPP